MDIENLLKMDRPKLEKRYNKLTCKDWREKAVIKGLIHRLNEKLGLLNNNSLLEFKGDSKRYKELKSDTKKTR